MNILDAIITRRSIRKFTDEAVSKEDIETLLKAAMYAPSAGNAQPWDFIVVTKQKARDFLSTSHPYISMAKQAPLAIIVCANLKKEKYPGFWQQDCSAAIQNILLAAHGIGLGAVWTGIYPIQERVEIISEYFNIPQNIIPVGALIIGHPDQKTSTPDRVNPACVHFETFF